MNKISGVMLAKRYHRHKYIRKIKVLRVMGNLSFGNLSFGNFSILWVKHMAEERDGKGDFRPPNYTM